MGRKSEKSTEEKLLISTFEDAFNLYVGCGRKYSRNTIAEILKVHPNTVESWATRNNEVRPNVHNLLKLIYFLPAGFNSMIRDIYDNSDKRNSIDHGESIAQIMKFAARYAEIIKDGKIDNAEARELSMITPETAEILCKIGSYCLNIGK